MEIFDTCDACRRSKGSWYVCDATGCKTDCTGLDGKPIATLVLNAPDSDTTVHLCAMHFQHAVKAVSAKMTVTYISTELA